MSDIDPIVVATSPHWWNTLWAGAGTLLAKLIIGRHLKTLDTVVDALSEVRKDVKAIHGATVKINLRVTRIEEKIKGSPKDRRRVGR